LLAKAPLPLVDPKHHSVVVLYGLDGNEMAAELQFCRKNQTDLLLGVRGMRACM
jgi:hypothetical protein